MTAEASGPPLTPPPRPHLNGLSMTEYTAAPTPPATRLERVTNQPQSSLVPEDFVLPSGYPDV